MSWTKTAARAVLPGFVYEKIKAVRWRRAVYRSLKRQGLLDASAAYIERNGNAVRRGPFAGMIYPRETALKKHSIPVLAGTYEQELHPCLEKIAQRKYDLVLDIGSAEGYYAVGLARLLRTRVLAFDPEPTERAYCEEAARQNDVADFVELRELFRPADVHRYRGQRVLCVCDCEGFEEQIFTPQTIGDTVRWDLLIELHGTAMDSLPALQWPQNVVKIPTAPRTGQYPELDGLGETKKLLSEMRSRQAWLWCDSEA
jgi:hypothetical protein